MTEHEAWVWVAQIRRSQGRKGEVLARILTDFPEKFAERRELWLLENAGTPQERSRPVTLAHFWLHKGSVVLHFDGVTSITEAEALRDHVVAIPREQRAQLDPDAYYVGDLMGCTVIDEQPESSRIVGVIEDVDRQAGPVALLIVRDERNQEYLIPLAKSYLRRVDLEGKQIVMALPAGLLELNAPSASEADHDS